ncbi:ferric reductase like transmembrane component-domain-containing protein [Xylariales sp. PMI_506]|nr:ferric reductase like transmembrane component-domain-containing protein [Xylariales sp. PMI_506]
MEDQLIRRHIQNYSDASALEPHWGYVDRVIPCTNDAGSCEYLDLVYASHDRGMLYSGILWSTIGGILFLWAIGRRVWPSPESAQAGQVVIAPDNEKGKTTARGAGARLQGAIRSGIRSYLLPDATRWIFGRTTRLQVLILSILAGYLLIWSFVGIQYKTWITPVKNSAGLYNTRTSMGPWSDRVGILAYALTPLSIMLSSRESILSLLTGVPYQSFNFMHRWLGYIILIQGSMHTITWTIIEVRLYQPQPTTAIAWITQTYMIWGIVAMILLLLIFVLSTPWGIRLTGYETFRKAHYVLAMVYIGACWGHWPQLDCFLLPSLIIWFLDRGVRLARSALVHYQYLPDGSSVGFRAAPAQLKHFPDAENGDILRLDFKHSQEAWKVGQHFYLCFAQSSIWQSHPFTPLNAPDVRDGLVEHSYIIRAKKGETKKIADLALKMLSEKSDSDPTTPVILSGPYGPSIMENVTPDVNMLCIAGGTGIAYVLPVLLNLAKQPTTSSNHRKVELLWAIRRKEDMQWVEKELSELKKGSSSRDLVVRVYITRAQGESASSTEIVHDKASAVDTTAKEVDSISASSSSSFNELPPSWEVRQIGSQGEHKHPDLGATVRTFVDNTVKGRTVVYASGPGGMISDLRSIVADCNSPARVWKGDERHDITLACDDRLEW